MDGSDAPAPLARRAWFPELTRACWLASLVVHLICLTPLGLFCSHRLHTPEVEQPIIQLVAQFSLEPGDSSESGQGTHESLVEILSTEAGMEAPVEDVSGEQEPEPTMAVAKDEIESEAEPLEDMPPVDPFEIPETEVAEVESPPKRLPEYLQPVPPPTRQPVPIQPVTLAAATTEPDPLPTRRPIQQTAAASVADSTNLEPGTATTAMPGNGLLGTGNKGGNGGGKPSTSFFGIRGQGVKVVYLIDASSSMRAHNAIGQAREELLQSIAALGSRQRFQVMFYNNSVQQWTREGSTDKLPFATDIHKSLVGQFIRRQSVKGGTQHLLGLEAALELQPDLIFMLTDGRQLLSRADLDRIRRRCEGRCIIHTVEFGVGEPLGGESFLGTLSRLTGGTAVYRDVAADTP